MAVRRGSGVIETKHGILLIREKASGKFSLPGGATRRGEAGLDALKRELKEETGLVMSAYYFLYDINGRHRQHKVFWLKADGELRLDEKEVSMIGFFDAGRGKRIRRDHVEGHVLTLIKGYIKSELRMKVRNELSRNFASNIRIHKKYLNQWEKYIKVNHE